MGAAVLVWIECRDCGNGRRWTAPPNVDQEYWARFKCSKCVEEGGLGRRIRISTVESTNAQSDNLLRRSAV